MRVKRVLVICGVMTVATLLTIAATTYWFFCPRFNPDIASIFLFHPQKGLPTPNPLEQIDGIKGEEVSFDSNGNKLNGWFYAVPGSTSCVLYNHGNAGQAAMRAWKLGWLMAMKESIFIYDYSGYGRSTGSPSAKQVVADACSAYDFLAQKKHYKPKQIIAYGESIGSVVTGELMLRREVGGVVFESGFTSIENVGKQKFPPFRIYPSFLMTQPPLDSTPALAKSHPPLLIVHGLKDDMIPYDQAEKVFRFASEPKRLILLPHSGHNDQSLDGAAFKKAMREFFATVNTPLSASI